jgi:hypothetical protein
MVTLDELKSIPFPSAFLISINSNENKLACNENEEEDALISEMLAGL